MDTFHGTTIVCVRREGRVALGGDGQVTLGDKVMKGNARKVRFLGEGKVLAGFAGGTADAFTLFEYFEKKLDQHGNLSRAAIELAKDWRTARMLRRLEALLCVADKDQSLLISGTGDVIEPERQSRAAESLEVLLALEDPAPVKPEAFPHSVAALHGGIERADSGFVPMHEPAVDVDLQVLVERIPGLQHQ